jgi:hypothetical protein
MIRVLLAGVLTSGYREAAASPRSDNGTIDEPMSVWLRYLAIAVLIGNGFSALWNLIALGGVIRLGSPGGNTGLLAFNLAASLAAIALAALIAAPARRGISRSTKVIAVPGVLAGGFGILTSAVWIYTLIGQSHNGLPMDARDIAVEGFIMERSVQNAFFSACTLALAILVLAARKNAAGEKPSA